MALNIQEDRIFLKLQEIISKWNKDVILKWRN